MDLANGLFSTLYNKLKYKRDNTIFGRNSLTGHYLSFYHISRLFLRYFFHYRLHCSLLASSSFSFSFSFSSFRGVEKHVGQRFFPLIFFILGAFFPFSFQISIQRVCVERIFSFWLSLSLTKMR